VDIPNQIQDGTVRYPFVEEETKVENENEKGEENGKEVEKEKEAGGMKVEFKNVAFRYPKGDKDVLRSVSFTILPGQLCVIVGANGEGKSSLLKLATRTQDPTAGEILVDGVDMKKIRLGDLRDATAVLFQDYTHFPLTVGQNIAMGDPLNATEAKIREAAKLGGALEFIDKLPKGMDSILTKNITDYAWGPSKERTKLLEKIYGKGAKGKHVETELSGGQTQRLALSRTFMKTNERSKLLIYDEPSAALDPQAEYDLFKTLCDLKGKKTMIFSSHRFGHLTRHADLIIYMKDGTVGEMGTHEELMAAGGKYAELYGIQAQAFKD
jgi:ABC-type multidrug transport system fused ATPase/permease subunit